MTKKEAIIAVAGQIINMMYNDILRENGVECLEAWCADGEVFVLNDMSEQDADECMELVREVAPIVDDLVLNHLNPDR